MPANIDKALPHFLINNAGIFALVSNRVYPNRLPQNINTPTSLPAVAFQIISTATTQSHGEASFLPRQRVQFTYYGMSVGICEQIANAFKAALDGYSGIMGTGTFTTEIEGVLFKDERSDSDSELGTYWRQQDYLIMWKE